MIIRVAISRVIDGNKVCDACRELDELQKLSKLTDLKVFNVESEENLAKMVDKIKENEYGSNEN